MEQLLSVNNRLEETKNTFEYFINNSTEDLEIRDSTKEKFEILVQKLKLTNIPEGNLPKTKHIIQFLEKEGFVYDGQVYLAQDTIERRSGNCTSLALLVVSFLESIGGRALVKEVSETKSATYRLAEETLVDLMTGLGDVRHDSPWPIEGGRRYGQLYLNAGHFLLQIDGQDFEVTDFGQGASEGKVEPIAGIRLLEPSKATYVTISGRIFNLMKKQDFDISEARKLILKGLETNDKEPWFWMSLFIISQLNFDDTEAQLAINKYLELADKTTASFHYNRYLREGNKTDLDEAYKMFPADSVYFMSKKVIELLKNKNKEDLFDARLNFKIMAHCVANSEMLSLPSFYLNYGSCLRELMEPEDIEQLLNLSGAKDYDPWQSPVTMYRATQDTKYLVSAIKSGLWPQIPHNQLLWAFIGNKAGLKICQNKLKELKKTYAKSSLFQKELANFD